MTYDEVDSKAAATIATRGPIEKTEAETRWALARARVIAGDLSPYALYDLKVWEHICTVDVWAIARAGGTYPCEFGPTGTPAQPVVGADLSVVREAA